MNPQLQSPLLQLPAELQLAIFELVVLEAEPLLLNCACDSSYRGDYDKWEEDQEAWTEGKLHAPEQPALTRTCSVIREMALPIFYKKNVFRAHYCYQADREMAVRWLDSIGQANRTTIRDIAFWDLNSSFDNSVPRDVLQLKRSQICKGMSGKIETEDVEDRCFHRVTFQPAAEDEFAGVEDLFASKE